MTWVIGVPTMFGYSIALADIQATLTYPEKTKQYFDCVQKLFPIGKFIAAGFSGSIELGYLFIEDLKRWADIPQGTAWIPECFSMDYQRRARFIYSKIPKNKQKPLELLFVAVYPQKDSGIKGESQTYAFKMVAPKFAPVAINAGQVISIGSGNNVKEYKRSIELFNDGYNPLMQMEINNPGGYGQALMINFSINVGNDPTPGISSHFHIAEVRRGVIRVGTNDHSNFDNDGKEINFRMPKVATNWQEFKQIMENEGVSLANAEAVA